MQTATAAASAAVAGLVGGADVPVEVVVSLPDAVYLAVRRGAGGRAVPLTADGDPPALCLVGPRAVRVPSALVLAAVPPLPIGAAGTVGGGRVTVAGLTVDVTRWWRTPRPALTPVESRRARLSTLRPPPLDAPTQRAVDELTAAITRGTGLHAPVARLLGRGPGLTPLGDDILAGALVTFGAVGDGEIVRQLGRAVLAAAPRATTAVSAALLWHAARGECVPQLDALLGAVGNGSIAAIAAARAELLGVGHSSGIGLAHGVTAALRASRTVAALRASRTVARVGRAAS